MKKNNHNAANGTTRSGQSTLTTTPLPASRKVYVEGTQPGMRVPFREVSLTPTHCWVLLYRARMALRECLEKGWFKR